MTFRREKKLSWLLITVFILFSAAVVSAGIFFYWFTIQRTTDDQIDELTSIMQLKSNQVSTWLEERKGEARFLQNSSGFIRNLSDYQDNPTPEMEGRLTAFLRPLQQNHYRNLVVLNSSGKEFLKLGEGESFMSAEVIETVIRSKEFRFDNLKIDYASGILHQEIYVPLSVTNDSVFALIILSIDPDKDLFQLIENWPIKSETAEALLVRRDDDSLLFLNNSRFRKNTALRYKVPLIQDGKSLLTSSIYPDEKPEAVDYRGKEVLRISGMIPQTNWHVIAKVDKNEIYDSIYLYSTILGISLLALIAATGFSISQFSKKKEYLEYQKLYKAEQEKLALKEHYEYLIKNANDIIILMDYHGKIIDVNEKAIEVYGYSKNEFTNIHISDLRVPEVRDSLKKMLSSLDEEGLIYETSHQKKSGEVIDVEVSSRLIHVNSQRFIQNIVRDVTERKKDEIKIERLSRVFALLSGINDAIIHENNRQRLFERICEISVDTGKFAAVGFGVVDPSTMDLEIAAKAGRDEGFFENLRINLNDQERGKGPTGNALRQGSYFVVNDIEESGIMRPWHEETIKRGFRSIGTFTVKNEREIIGALMFYSSEKGFFDEEEIRLLNGICSNIAFAIESIKKADLKTRAEDALKKSELNLKTLAENIPDLTLYMYNNNFEVAFSEGKNLFNAEQGQNLTAAVPSQFADKMQLVFQNKNYYEEFSSNGDFYSFSLHPVKNEAGDKIISGILLVQNITERKKRESALAESEKRLKGFFNLNNIYMSIIELRGDEIYFIMPNKKLAELHNMTVEELSSKPLRELRDSETHNYWIDIFRNVDKYKRPVSVEYSVLKNNRRMWFIAEISPIEYSEGKNPLFSYSAFNITDRKKAEIKLKKAQGNYRRFLQSGLIAVADTDNNKTIISANKKFLEITGYSSTDLEQGKIKFSRLSPAEYDEIDEGKLIEASQKGYCEPFEKPILRKDGSLLKVQMSISAHEDLTEGFSVFLYEI